MEVDGNKYRTRAEMVAAGLPLRQQLEALLDKIAHLKMQIDGAKAEAAATGNYSDRDWYNRANHALRMAQKEHQQVQLEIGEQNRAKKREGAAAWEKAFIDAARRRLEPELFMELVAEAREETSGA